MKVIVARARLAGLTCAKVLGEPGAEVALFEASDGGSGGTDEREGLLLGRGRKVLGS
jgi:predicted NAD/FAD-dependent oxidoreductase